MKALKFILVCTICALLGVLLAKCVFGLTPGEATGTIPWLTIRQSSSPHCRDCTYKPEQTVIYTTVEPFIGKQEKRWTITFKP